MSRGLSYHPKEPERQLGVAGTEEEARTFGSEQVPLAGNPHPGREQVGSCSSPGRI